MSAESRDVGDLRALRELVGVSQADLAARMGVLRPAVSRLERRADMNLGSLRQVVEALGGRLEIAARLPDGTSVRLGKLESGQGDGNEPDG